MAVSRRSTEELAAEVRAILNRPQQDSLFSFPEDYYEGLSRAHRYFRRKVAQHAPGLLKEVTTVASTDDGESYDLGDHHYGDLEVWAPPGPPSGRVIPPALPESPYFGFYVQGTSLYLTNAKDYTPGIYIRWIPVTTPDLDQDEDHTLPAYAEDALIYRAAFHLATTPGFMGDPSLYVGMARAEWVGDPQDPSDTGILGIISQMSAYDGIETSTALDGQPWFRRISG